MKTFQTLNMCQNEMDADVSSRVTNTPVAIPHERRLDSQIMRQGFLASKGHSGTSRIVDFHEILEGSGDAVWDQLFTSRQNAKGALKYKLLNQWEGTVLEVDSETFTASLNSLTNPSSGEEIAEIEISNLPTEDQERIRPGSMLYWSIGQETLPSGTITRASRIFLKRTAPWTKLDVRRAERASEQFNLFFNDPS